jgi:hypothetical protein
VATYQCTCLAQVAEPVPLYKNKHRKLKKPNKATRVRWATVQTTIYPPLQNSASVGRRVPWLNLRGHWLAQAGFEIGTPYHIEVRDKKLLLVGK